VAQLGARFHGMEEVVGSIPTRSTNFFLKASTELRLSGLPFLTLVSARGRYDCQFSPATSPYSNCLFRQAWFFSTSMRSSGFGLKARATLQQRQTVAMILMVTLVWLKPLHLRLIVHPFPKVVMPGTTRGFPVVYCSTHKAAICIREF
jgi:hypothetical protein